MKVEPVEESEDVKILPPDYSLKETLGKNIDTRDVFSEDVIAEAQGNLVSQQQNFFRWFAEDIDMLEHYYKALEKEPDDVAMNIDHLHLLAIAIKSQGGTFGFDLASEVARSLYLFLHDFSYSKEHCMVIRQHIDALRVILEKRISGTGGEAGQELLRDMARLTKKFKKPV